MLRGLLVPVPDKKDAVISVAALFDENVADREEKWLQPSAKDTDRVVGATPEHACISKV